MCTDRFPGKGSLATVRLPKGRGGRKAKSTDPGAPCCASSTNKTGPTQQLSSKAFSAVRNDKTGVNHATCHWHRGSQITLHTNTVSVRLSQLPTYTQTPVQPEQPEESHSGCKGHQDKEIIQEQVLSMPELCRILTVSQLLLPPHAEKAGS